jgi:hypothetical protein
MAMTLNRVAIPSPNYSSRGGSGVRLVVLHTAEGALTYQALGNYFANPSSGVSSHTGIDDTAGTVGEYVPPGYKAWTQGNANPYSVAAELCAFAGWDRAEWDRHPAMLLNAAEWVREECGRFGIPIRALTGAEAQGGAAGVCQHVDLGADGGGHWDCGPGFPMADVIAQASRGGAPAPAQRKGRNMIASTNTGGGYWTTTSDGAVGAFGDAQYKGGGFDPDVVSGEVIGIAGKGTDGYWLFASDGGVLAFGSAGFYGRPDRA